jgi:hypothetical protein
MEKYFLNWYPILTTREKMLSFVENNTKLDKKQKGLFITLWDTASGVDVGELYEEHPESLPTVDGCLNGCDCECEDCDEYTCNCDCEEEEETSHSFSGYEA